MITPLTFEKQYFIFVLSICLSLDIYRYFIYSWLDKVDLYLIFLLENSCLPGLVFQMKPLKIHVTLTSHFEGTRTKSNVPNES